ncbi:MAG: hypothetical protein Q9160_009367, partial [Pyrenula sp. 1 TL-2023]
DSTHSLGWRTLDAKAKDEAGDGERREKDLLVMDVTVLTKTGIRKRNTWGARGRCSEDLERDDGGSEGRETTGREEYVVRRLRNRGEAEAKVREMRIGWIVARRYFVNVGYAVNV